MPSAWLTKLSRVLRASLVLGVLLGATLALGYLILYLLDSLSASTITQDQHDAAIRLASTILSVLLLIFASASLFLIYRAVWRLRHTLGSTPLAQLLGLATAAIFFRAAVFAFVLAPWAVLRALATDLPRVGESLTGRTPDPATVVTLSSFSTDIARLLQSLAATTLDTVFSQVRAFPWTDAALALAVWLLLATFLAVPASLDPALAQTSRLHLWWQRLSAEARRRHILGGILVIAAYLSIAAIVAIPWLTETSQSPAFTKERFEARLRNVALSEADLQRDLSVDTLSSSDPLLAFVVSLDTLRADFARALKDLKARADAAEWESALQRLRDQLTRAHRDRTSLYVGLPSYRQQILEYQKNLLETVLADFETNTASQMTQGERSQYAQSLERWFDDRIADLRDAVLGLPGPIESLRRLDVSLVAWATARRDEVYFARSMILKHSRDTIVPLPRPDLALLRIPAPTEGLLPPSLGLPSVDIRPQPPDPASQWGPFRWVAQWLLRTRTLALAQITGMLGFGLFGAAIAALGGPQTAETGKWRPLTDLGFVMIFGFAATLVVFLSVKGGLAIVGQSGGEPNSYMLFAACFVGAIYSDRVWTWAQDHILPKNGLTVDRGTVPPVPTRAGPPVSGAEAGASPVVGATGPPAQPG